MTFSTAIFLAQIVAVLLAVALGRRHGYERGYEHGREDGRREGEQLLTLIEQKVNAPGSGHGSVFDQRSAAPWQ